MSGISHGGVLFVVVIQRLVCRLDGSQDEQRKVYIGSMRLTKE